MSALGQKQTCAVQTGMSALPPKADICGTKRAMSAKPIADIRAQRLSRLKPVSSDYPRWGDASRADILEARGQGLAGCGCDY